MLFASWAIRISALTNWYPKACNDLSLQPHLFLSEGDVAQQAGLSMVKRK
jgi:hypothetical protein